MNKKVGIYMKSTTKILVTFLLNISFGIFEFFGGLITNSVAIISDSVHDICDALSIGIAYFLERKSKHRKDSHYTFGYARYSVIGGLITTIILLVSSVLVIYNAILRLLNPVAVDYDGMLFFAIVGLIINSIAVFYTKGGKSINEKAINLHMLEDVMGWIIVIIGSIVIKITEISIIDPILSIIVTIFIVKSAIHHLKEIIDLFLEKTPDDISLSSVKKDILSIKGIKEIHHLHIWSMDGIDNYATMHISYNGKSKKIKDEIRNCLKKYHIKHSTIEIEDSLHPCKE